MYYDSWSENERKRRLFRLLKTIEPFVGTFRWKMDFQMHFLFHNNNHFQYYQIFNALNVAEYRRLKWSVRFCFSFPDIFQLNNNFNDCCNGSIWIELGLDPITKPFSACAKQIREHYENEHDELFMIEQMVLMNEGLE